MIIKLKDFKEIATKILLATDGNTASNLKLRAKDQVLTLSVTNSEYFVCIKMPLETDEELTAVVDAKAFLNLIAGLDAETFALTTSDSTLFVKAGKSNYKLAMIYDNAQLLDLPPIIIQNKTVEMNISKDILESILNVNSKELLKLKNLTDVSELQKLYYIDETGCFTFTSGACLNSFTLEKPVKLLLTDRVVKLFKLFKEDVYFSLGQDQTPSGLVETKVTFETSNIYLAARVNCDAAWLNKVKGPCDATKRHISATYPYHLVLSTAELSSAINRLLSFTKNSTTDTNMAQVPIKATITDGEITLADEFDNCETITIENGVVEEPYEMMVNIADIKLVLDAYKNDHITLNCGANHILVFTKDLVYNLLTELKKK